jgi:hypothetical protein
VGGAARQRLEHDPIYGITFAQMLFEHIPSAYFPFRGVVPQWKTPNAMRHKMCNNCPQPFTSLLY